MLVFYFLLSQDNIIIIDNFSFDLCSCRHFYLSQVDVIFFYRLRHLLTLARLWTQHPVRYIAQRKQEHTSSGQGEVSMRSKEESFKITFSSAETKWPIPTPVALLMDMILLDPPNLSRGQMVPVAAILLRLNFSAEHAKTYLDLPLF